MKIEIVTIGEIIVEVMRKEVGIPLDTADDFIGPFPSGAPAIFIDAAAKAGHKAGIIGALGDDDFGRCVSNRLKKDGVDISQVKVIPDRATGVAFVTYFRDGSRKFLYHIAHAAAGQISGVSRKYLSGVKFLHIMGCSLSISQKVRDVCYDAVKAVKKAGGCISLDPNLRPELLGINKVRQICMPVLKASKVVLPSGNEACVLTGRKNIDTACRALLDMGPDIVALKKGEKGCKVFTREREIEVKGFKVKAIDPTGAGDCFDAGFICGLIEGLDIEDTARLANAMGALGASKKGPMEGTFSRKEIEMFMKRGG